MATATPSTIDSTPAEFDEYAARYEDALNTGLELSGEGPEYYAKRRIEWTARVVPSPPNGPSQSNGSFFQPNVTTRILDFGCGVGLAAAQLRRAFCPRELWGYDPSAPAIARARQELGDEQTFFTADAASVPADRFDGVYVNGVFHHIDPAERPAALALIRRALRPGGWFAFWENNPWNPGTRMVMRRIPFDRDAVVISPREGRRLLSQAGFEVLRRDAWFLFPRQLAWLRPLERLVHRLPLGGQYLVLARKPTS